MCKSELVNDVLIVLKDGNEEVRTYERTWTQYTIQIAANDEELIFIYHKDGSGSTWEDACYVDKIEFETTSS